MAAGSGVSASKIEDGTGRWRVRWRETLREGGEVRVVQREKKVRDEETAIELRAKVLRAIEIGEVVDLEPVRDVATVAALDGALVAWLASRKARGASDGTIRSYASRIGRLTRTIRDLRGIGKDWPIPVDVLSRGLLMDAILRWRASGLGETTICGTATTALDAWTWIADDLAAYPGTPTPPRDPSTVLPTAPVYAAPPAPTLAEVDAMLRALRSPWAFVATGAAIVMRYTGLRISQTLALTRGDLDAAARTLTVRTGKSKREKATARVQPLPAATVVDLEPYLSEGDDPTAPLLRRRKDVRASPNRNHHPTAALTAAWESATTAGLVRRDVWAPSNRTLARPDHALRAAYQGHLVEAGIRAEVVDALVGHAGSLRSRHYVDPSALAKAMREAVDAMPPIDWKGPKT